MSYCPAGRTAAIRNCCCCVYAATDSASDLAGRQTIQYHNALVDPTNCFPVPKILLWRKMMGDWCFSWSVHVMFVRSLNFFTGSLKVYCGPTQRNRFRRAFLSQLNPPG